MLGVDAKDSALGRGRMLWIAEPCFAARDQRRIHRLLTIVGDQSLLGDVDVQPFFAILPPGRHALGRIDARSVLVAQPFTAVDLEVQSAVEELLLAGQVYRRAILGRFCFAELPSLLVVGPILGVERAYEGERQFDLFADLDSMKTRALDGAEPVNRDQSQITRHSVASTCAEEGLEQGVANLRFHAFRNGRLRGTSSGELQIRW